ncbi:diflavin oxidoreductase [Mangrovibacterium diazotrophicum]|uniref:Sulfite reductase (NADPH) flavoprotein alpha-component n=1 Tax=Mangrovibacterium diazotrophicum TaxID=1261403 RepID=A0A419W574_9BACT|nr:flavodoxin domain-containing protein [Mangrovibacterium diazotrophicum]RKD90570.1 sulfite reductase (NADPH) flavoprotein alpha-component [Mangrovibacterium diazotrophicum]
MFGTIRKFFGEQQLAAETGLITILFGGKSGNAEFVASETFRHLKEKGKKVRLKNMSSFKAENLASEKTVLFVVSTHGEGDPPPVAVRFFKHLKNKQIQLDHLEFSVCALGDSDYEHFCEAGKTLERLLLDSGAKPFSPRVDCDEAFETNAAGWISTVSKLLAGSSNGDSFLIEEQKNRSWKKAIVKEKRCLNPESAEGVYHISLAINGREVQYKSGDSIGVAPQNSPRLVALIVAKTGLNPEELIREEEGLCLREFLLTKAEITTLSRGVMKRYADLSGDENLSDLLADDKASLDYQRKHDLMDMLNDFPYLFNTSQLVSLPDKLKIRYYSISSFQQMNADELQLTVKQVRFNHKNRERQGSCSTYLSEWLEVGTAVSFFIAPDDEFRLPVNSSTPAIFIAAGTGIAPVRAFLQERRMHTNTRNWLFFGEKTRKSDYLYGEELDGWKREGLLENVSLAFSRDQSTKFYVQDAVLKEGTELLRWIDQGAHIYVCGSIKMGQSVKQTINALLQAEDNGLTVDQLQADNRYCEDVY